MLIFIINAHVRVYYTRIKNEVKLKQQQQRRWFTYVAPTVLSFRNCGVN